MKVAVVTGASKGLGSEIVMELANAGYSTVVHYRSSRSDAEKIVSKIKKRGGDSIALPCDLTNEEKVSKMFDEVNSNLGRIDLLVNNVGNFLFKKFSDTSNFEFRDIVESNIYATLYCCRAALSYMRKQKSGYIINIGSVGAERFTLREKSVPYFLAKNAVYILTKTMAWEEAPNGIHINMISPSSMKTDIFEKKDFPMKREARYKDVISVLKFLTSPDAYYINGANIEVSGGFIPGMK